MVDDHMASSCYMGLFGDSNMPSEVDMIIRATSVKQKAGRSAGKLNLVVLKPQNFSTVQVSVEKIHVIGWLDLTKVGVLTQKDINKFSSWCEKLLAKNPTSSDLNPFVCFLWQFSSHSIMSDGARQLCCHGIASSGICSWMWGFAGGCPAP